MTLAHGAKLQLPCVQDPVWLDVINRDYVTALHVTPAALALVNQIFTLQSVVVIDGQATRGTENWAVQNIAMTSNSRSCRLLDLQLSEI